MELQSFLASMIAVSVAVERVVEILKQVSVPIPIIGWLFTPNPDKKREAWRCALIHILSGVIGGIVARVSQVTVPGLPSGGGAYALIGLLSAGGSAFWNHALDLVKAVKVQKEQAAKIAVVNASGIPGASAVNL